MERIAQLYKELTGREPQRITPLAGAGSNRQYFRVEGEGESLIAVIGTNQEENEAFIDLSKRFKQGNLPVPAVLAVSDDHMVYLQEDCGDLSLSAFMAQHRQEDGTLDEVALDALKATIRELPRFQFLPEGNHPRIAPFPVPAHCQPNGIRVLYALLPSARDGQDKRDVRPQLLQILFPQTQRCRVQRVQTATRFRTVGRRFADGAGRHLPLS